MGSPSNIIFFDGSGDSKISLSNGPDGLVMTTIGALAVITGIALTCLNHQAAMICGNISLSCGAPILLMGIIEIVNAVKNRSSQERHDQPNLCSGERGHRLGKGKKNTPSPAWRNKENEGQTPVSPK